MTLTSRIWKCASAKVRLLLPVPFSTGLHLLPMEISAEVYHLLFDTYNLSKIPVGFFEHLDRNCCLCHAL